MIRFITTGGTIDDIEYTFLENASFSRPSLLPELLKRGIFTGEYVLEEAFCKDSRFIEEEDREFLAQRCKECSEEKIIITHGTFTLSDTAKFLESKKIPKTIVVTGAMIPGNKENTDALFNLGAASIAVQLLPPGVFVVMNGKIFSGNNVKKNNEKGIFENEF